jgi:hypothetical protein
MTIARLSDDELLKEVARLAGDERSATARLIAALAEIDARRLYLGQGCPSLFVYCTRVLHLSEHAAYGRIEAARVARRFPVVLEMLVRGDLTLTTVSLLASHFTDSNHLDLLARAHRRSKREVEEIVAQVRPRPDVAAAVRKLPDRLETTALALDAVEHAKPTPARTPAPPPVCARPSAAVTPLAPSRYKLQLTIDRTTQEKLYLVRDLMRHAVPSGDLATILNRALDALLNELQRRKSAAAARPQPGRTVAPNSRHIPAAVRREVWARDGGRCAFRGPGGTCGETAFVEFHHVRPFAAGGEATVDNIELRCRAHNQYEADLFFCGPVFVRESRAVFRTSVSAAWPLAAPVRQGGEVRAMVAGRRTTPLRTYRSVSDGSIRAARSAGTSDAVTTVSISPTDATRPSSLDIQVEPVRRCACSLCRPANSA